MKSKANKPLFEQKIDKTLVAQATKDSAWGKPIRVHRSKPACLSIPADLAARAAFLAQIHRTKSVEEWLTHIIQERVELEEAAYAGLKHDLTKTG